MNPGISLLVVLGMLAGIGLEHIALTAGLLDVAIPYVQQPVDDYTVAPKRR